MNKKLKITIKDWDYVCGDGCCSSWGCDITINGEKTDSIEMSYGHEITTGLEVVLTHLGYEVEIDY